MNTDRKKELEKKLQSRGLEFRLDSALCSKYVDGTTDLHIDFIVERMCQMKYLYEYCNMKQIKSQVYKQYRNELSRGIISESNVSSRAEKIALDTYSYGKYPDKYPWEYQIYNWKYAFNWVFTKINCHKLYLISGIFMIPIGIKLAYIIHNFNKYKKN